ncbi:hypothetical protein IM40_04740 [Candidatus Paracaedimonas acanthamoebae]|nr:hypothetical protein IM40_04740 [Candidatus Paracaedimonas acanthamoebae]
MLFFRAINPENILFFRITLKIIHHHIILNIKKNKNFFYQILEQKKSSKIPLNDYKTHIIKFKAIEFPRQNMY